MLTFGSSMVQWLRSLTLMRRIPGSIPGSEPKNMFPSLVATLLLLTCGAGAVDNKDLAVSSDQGNADCLYTPIWASWENSVVH